MKKTATACLQVHQAKFRDVYKDVARIHESHRGGIPSGKICKLSAKRMSRLVVVRGIDEKKPSQHGWIMIDEVTREHLGLDFEESCCFDLEEAGWYQRFRWAWHASEPGSQTAAQLAVVSILLGILSTLITIAPFAVPCLSRLFAWICRWAA